MSKPSVPTPISDGIVLQDEVLGRGASLLRRTFSPQLQEHIQELKKAAVSGERKFTALLNMLEDLEGALSQLERSEERLHLALAGTNQGLYDLDLQTGRAVVSPEYVRMIGVPEAAFDERRATFFILIHPEDIAIVRGAVEAALAGQKPYDLDHRIVRPDGSIRWVHEKANVEHDDQGKPVRMVGVVQDITDRRQLEEELRQAQKMEAVGHLAGGVAHDYNNILIATIMQLALLQENTTLDDEARTTVRELEQLAERAAHLTRQLLLFGRRSMMQFQPVDLNEVLAELVKMLRRLLGEHISFEFLGEAGLPPVEADAGMIEQVVTNLCVNTRAG